MHTCCVQHVSGSNQGFLSNGKIKRERLPLLRDDSAPPLGLCKPIVGLDGVPKVDCIDEKPVRVGRGLLQNWTTSDGCEVITPKLSDAAMVYTVVSAPTEKLVCTTESGSQVVLSPSDEQPEGLQCETRAICTTEAKCQYYDYTEMCGITTNSEVLRFQDNCVAVEYIRRGDLDGKLDIGKLCKPYNSDQNTPKRTAPPEPERDSGERASSANKLQPYQRLLYWWIMVFYAFCCFECV